MLEFQAKNNDANTLFGSKIRFRIHIIERDALQKNVKMWEFFISPLPTNRLGTPCFWKKYMAYFAFLELERGPKNETCGGGPRRVVRNQTFFWKIIFALSMYNHSWDPQNMFYTWSHLPMPF